MTAILALSTSLVSQNFIYHKDGNKTYFEKDVTTQIISISTLASPSKKEEIKLIIETICSESEILELYSYAYKTHITETQKENLKGQLGADTSFVTISDRLVCDDGSIRWCTGKIVVKALSHEKLQDILANERIPYKDIQTIGYKGEVFCITLGDFNDKSIIYANELYESGEVEFAQPNFGRYIYPQTGNTFFWRQWGLDCQQYLYPTVTINAVEAWNYATGTGVKVAVVDNGVQLNHPDLDGNILSGYDATGFSNEGINGDCREQDYHGTCCAGIIAAENNNEGIIGTAYNAKIIPIRIYHTPSDPDDPALQDIWVSDGIYQSWYNYAADILLLPWSISQSDLYDEAIIDALTEGRNGKGCVIVCPSGRYSSSVDYSVSYPANSNPEIITVGAITREGTRREPGYLLAGEYGSRYGESLDMMGPGEYIATTDITGVHGYNNMDYEFATGPTDEDSLSYTNRFGGTSAACSYVAGVAALVLSANPNLTSHQVSNILEQTAQKTGSYNYSYSSTRPNGTWNIEMGYGLVDAGSAVQQALTIPNSVDIYVRDNTSDNGREPNITTSTFSSSPDIWLTLNNNVVTNPQANTDYVVHVRVRNTSNSPFYAIGKKVKLYWAYYGGDMSWNNGWGGAPHYPWSTCPVHGGYVSEQSIPSFSLNYPELLFNWHSPSRNIHNCYVPIVGNWSFALMAQITDDYPISGETMTNCDLTTFVSNNNNVAYKVFTVLDNSFPPILVTNGGGNYLPGDEVTLSVEYCNMPDANYTWYNMSGDSVGNGETIYLKATSSQAFCLRAHSELYDAIAYDTVSLSVRRCIITRINPNPANNQVTIEYRLASNVNTANITLTSTTGQLFYSSRLNTTVSSLDINLQAIPAGQYIIRIESNGEILDIKSLLIQ